MAHTRIFNGRVYKLEMTGYISDRKSTAQKKAAQLRQNGFYARVVTRNLPGTVKDSRGKITKRINRKVWHVYSAKP
jgi:hypothetical protein